MTRRFFDLVALLFGCHPVFLLEVFQLVPYTGEGTLCWNSMGPRRLTRDLGYRLQIVIVVPVIVIVIVVIIIIPVIVNVVVLVFPVNVLVGPVKLQGGNLDNFQVCSTVGTGYSLANSHARSEIDSFLAVRAESNRHFQHSCDPVSMLPPGRNAGPELVKPIVLINLVQIWCQIATKSVLRLPASYDFCDMGFLGLFHIAPGS
jgi:hypothetical protein